jgi:hypothetical protein
MAASGHERRFKRKSRTSAFSPDCRHNRRVVPLGELSVLDPRRGKADRPERRQAAELLAAARTASGTAAKGETTER